jgi:hypothetical protein
VINYKAYFVLSQCTYTNEQKPNTKKRLPHG